MTKKKLMMAGLSAGLVAVVGVGGTLAYLSAQSDVVENSFTVGKGFIPGPGSDSAILLDEVKVDPETGKPVENGKRVLENEYNNLLPGDVRVKDPTVHLGGGSVDGYVFVEVKGWDQFDEDIVVNGYNEDIWQNVFESGVKYDGVYVYSGEKAKDFVVDLDSIKEGTWVNLEPVFTGIEVNGDITQEELEKLDFHEMTLKAVVVQADNLTVEEAYEEAKEMFAANTPFPLQ